MAPPALEERPTEIATEDAPVVGLASVLVALVVTAVWTALAMARRRARRLDGDASTGELSRPAPKVDG